MTFSKQPMSHRPLLVLFAGQSNMLGHAKATDGMKPSNRQVFAWNNRGKDGCWRIAKLGEPPFNTTPGQPNNAALHFADHLQRYSGRAVYLAGWPVNGSTLLSWSGLDAPNMARLIDELEFALASPASVELRLSHVDCFLWLQGESDDAGATMVKEPRLVTQESYSTNFHQMLDGLMTRPWWNRQDTKIIAGELVADGWLSARNDFYGDPGQWRSISTMGVVRSKGLTDVGDGAHYSGAALQEMGSRMFETWCDLTQYSRHAHRNRPD